MSLSLSLLPPPFNFGLIPRPLITSFAGPALLFFPSTALQTPCLFFSSSVWPVNSLAFLCPHCFVPPFPLHNRGSLLACSRWQAARLVIKQRPCRPCVLMTGGAIGFQPSRSSELHHKAEPVLRWDVSVRERSRARTRLSEDQAARSRDRQGGFPARLALGFALEEDSSSSQWIWRSSSRQCGPLAHCWAGRLPARAFSGEASGAGGVPEGRPSSSAHPPVCCLDVPTVPLSRPALLACPGFRAPLST